MELRRGGPAVPKVVALLCVCLIVMCVLIASGCREIAFSNISSSSSSRSLQDSPMQVAGRGWRSAAEHGRRRRRMRMVGGGSGGGPGSYPPRCAGKCGRCAPCRAVHVAVPPGTPVITEYYPEAWRCKCGSRLYMP